jgi:hypothetical protein
VLGKQRAVLQRHDAEWEAIRLNHGMHAGQVPLVFG